MSETKVSGSVKQITDSLTDLLDHIFRTGMDLLQTFGSTGADLTAKFAPQLSKFAPQLMKSLNLPTMGGCCQIPPPCWMPKELSAVLSHVCPGGTASLRFRITNCGLAAETVTVQADQGATINPPSVQLGRMQRGSITVTLAVPATTNSQPTEILVWVHGCKSYFLRWSVQSSDRGCACVHEIDVDDCPDLIHHWYDHFYCQRPCQPGGQGSGR